MKKRFVMLMLIGVLAVSGCQSVPNEKLGIENADKENGNDMTEKNEDTENAGNGEDVNMSVDDESSDNDSNKEEHFVTELQKPTATPEPTKESTSTPTAIPTPTAQSTATPTATPTPTVKPTPTMKPTAIPTPTAKPTATPTPVPHMHEWEEIIKVVNHEEQGHWEEVIVKETWTETMGSWRTKCNGCGVDMTGWSDDELTIHCGLVCQSSYGSYYESATVKHPAVTEKQWIIDLEAYEETVVTGYKCDCGETK